MDKLTAIKIKYDDGTYSDEIPVSVLAENVEWDSTHTLVDILGSIDVDVTGTIQDQISQLFNEKVSNTQLQKYIVSQLNTDVTTWLNNNVNPAGSAVMVDKSLSIEGAAADALSVKTEILSLAKGTTIGYEMGYMYTKHGIKTKVKNLFCACTPLIPCVTGDQFEYRGQGNYSYAAACLFDKDKNFVLEYHTPEPAHNSICPSVITINIPENINYISFSSYNRDEDFFHFEVTNNQSLPLINMKNKIMAIYKNFNKYDYDFNNNLVDTTTLLNGILTITGINMIDIDTYKFTFVHIPKPGEYTIYSFYSIYGTNSTFLLCLDENFDFVELMNIDRPTANMGPVDFKITNSNIKYIGYNIPKSSINVAYVVKKDATLLGHTNRQTIITIPEDTYLDTKILHSPTFAEYQSENLLNYLDMVPGYAYTSGLVVPENTVWRTAFIKIPEPGIYLMPCAPRCYGTNINNGAFVFWDNLDYFSRAPLNFLTDPGSTSSWATFAYATVDLTNIWQQGLILGVTCHFKNTYEAVVAKRTDIPKNTLYYKSGYTTSNLYLPTVNENPLYKKTIVFDGDSICHAYGDQYKNITNKKLGWAARIGENNHMDWYNYAVGGGTLVTGLTTAAGGERYSVSKNIDVIYNTHNHLDYYIFEGGTNDADLLGLNPEKYGTLDPNDYTNENFDNTKFYNAIDYICYKATKYWPKAKIGFIVAPKMGQAATSRNRRKFYFDMAMEACKKWGVPCLNLWDESTMNPCIPNHYDNTKTADENWSAGSLYYDGQHPTSKGYDFLTPKIETWIKGL